MNVIAAETVNMAFIPQYRNSMSYVHGKQYLNLDYRVERTARVLASRK